MIVDDEPVVIELEPKPPKYFSIMAALQTSLVDTMHVPEHKIKKSSSLTVAQQEHRTKRNNMQKQSRKNNRRKK